MQSLPRFIRANITKIMPRHLMFLITWFCMEEAQVLRVELDAKLCCNYHWPKINNLTNMELILKHNHCEKWKWLLEILECCPKLLNLTIHEDHRNAEEVVYNWIDPIIVPKCLSTQLRTCLLNDHKSSTESGLQFAKYIMQNSKVLNTMTIKSTSSRNRKAKYQMLLKLASLPRASTTCKFVFD
ncbi:putative FBD domain-containing protein [Medicago truncatula]|nr:putative FBD domain-containing protein [Medicago truncatula]